MIYYEMYYSLNESCLEGLYFDYWGSLIAQFTHLSCYLVCSILKHMLYFNVYLTKMNYFMD